MAKGDDSREGDSVGNAVASTPAALTRLPGRLLLVSSALPPERSGAAVVLGRLFGNVDPDDYRIATFESPAGDAAESGDQLPAKTFRMSTAWQLPQPTGYLLRWVRSFRHFGVETVQRARSLAEVIVSERCDAVMGVSGANPNLGATYLAALLTRRPLFVCMFDDWRYQLLDATLRKATSLLQARVLAAASGVLVPSEALRDSLERRYGSACTVIRNPVDDADLEEPPAVDQAWPTRSGEIRIVYTGQVYAAQMDSLQRVADALASPKLRNATLQIYTAQEAAGLERQGLREEVEIYPHLAADEVRRVQRLADVLLLPLAFCSPYPQIIRTAAPTKLGEYLASGRPILVHAPAGSFVADYARSERVAEVVDNAAPELIVDAIKRISEDDGHRRRLGLRARSLAEREFSVAEAQRRLLDLLDTPRRHMAA